MDAAWGALMIEPRVAAEDRRRRRLTTTYQHYQGELMSDAQDASRETAASIRKLWQTLEKEKTDLGMAEIKTVLGDLKIVAQRLPMILETVGDATESLFTADAIAEWGGSDRYDSPGRPWRPAVNRAHGKSHLQAENLSQAIDQLSELMVTLTDCEPGTGDSLADIRQPD